MLEYSLPQFSSITEKVSYYLQKIRSQAHLNVFPAVFESEALEQARQVDSKIASGKAGKLAGLVVGIKDVFCYEGHALQASSKILSGFKSLFSATVIERLLAEDAIIIGRQNCDEFAMGSSNENSVYGPVRNALNPERVPGGSSGGSAVAVQAYMCDVSIGSDTGGSVRQPAAFCGIIGLKPTYGRISRHGLIAYASSFDSVGVLGRNIPEIAQVLEVISGKDGHDSTLSSRPKPSAVLSPFQQKAKIAFFKETLYHEGLSKEIYERTKASIEYLKEEGHLVEEISFPFLDALLPAYYILTTAEASSNLSRYDGVRYGYRSQTPANDLIEMYKNTRSEGFGEEVKRRIMLGTFVLSADYYDAYYTKAQKVRRLIKEATEKVFASYDFILMPVTPDTAFKIGEKQSDPLQMYLADLYTVQANLMGIPAISIPNGSDSQGLPIGLQLMAASYEEEKLLSFAEYLMNGKITHGFL